MLSSVNCYKIKIMYYATEYLIFHLKAYLIATLQTVCNELKTHTINTGVISLSLDQARKLSKRGYSAMPNYSYKFVV